MHATMTRAHEPTDPPTRPGHPAQDSPQLRKRNREFLQMKDELGWSLELIASHVKLSTSAVKRAIASARATRPTNAEALGDELLGMISDPHYQTPQVREWLASDVDEHSPWWKENDPR